MKKAIITIFTLAIVISLGSINSFSHVAEAKIIQSAYDPGY